MTPAVTLAPRPLCGCGEYPVADALDTCGVCALAEVNGESRPTARPEKGPCGRIHITGFPCPTCAAPQWIWKPTDSGLWWAWDGETVDLVNIRKFDTNGEVCWGHARVLKGESMRGLELPLGWRYLDARLTPPAPPVAR